MQQQDNHEYPCLDQRQTCYFFQSKRPNTQCSRDWSSAVCSSDLRLSEPTLNDFSLQHLGRMQSPSLREVLDLHPARKPGEIGRASCREEWRSRWLPYHLKKRLATKSNQIKQLIRNCRSDSLQRRF